LGCTEANALSPVGLSVEHSQEEALQAELSLVQAEEAALPLKISKLQEALRLENLDLQRRESGAYLLTQDNYLTLCDWASNIWLQYLQVWHCTRSHCPGRDHKAKDYEPSST